MTAAQRQLQRQRRALKAIGRSGDGVRLTRLFQAFRHCGLSEGEAVSLQGVVQEPEMEQSARNGHCIYTVGYEGRAIGDFLATLLSLRIKVLVDVRDSASSRKLGFSSSMLQRLAEKIGMEYHHFPALGVPSEQRGDFRRLDTVQCARDWYSGQVTDTAEDVLAGVAEICREGPAALLCYERDERYCHRYPLAAILSRMTGIGVSHL